MHHILSRRGTTCQSVANLKVGVVVTDKGTQCALWAPCGGGWEKRFDTGTPLSVLISAARDHVLSCDGTERTASALRASGDTVEIGT